MDRNRMPKISIEPGTKSHKVILRYKGRTIVQYIQADIPAEVVQRWAEKLYDKLISEEKHYSKQI